MIRIRAALDRLPLDRLAGLALWFALVIGVLYIPLQMRDFAMPVVPRAQLAAAPELQTRATLHDVPYAALREANTLLPADARVLVVTDGIDVRYRAYTTFHRALYYLTPSVVWWLSPAPHDSTWGARWWHSAPLTESAIAAFAQSKNVDSILILANQNLFLSNRTLARWDGAKLVQLHNHAAARIRPLGPEFAPADWQWRVLGALALFVLNGALIVQLLAIGGFAPGRIEWFSLAWCLGVGLVTFLLVGSLALGLTLSQAIRIPTATALSGSLLLCYQILQRKMQPKGLTFRGADSATRNLKRKPSHTSSQKTSHRLQLVPVLLVLILLIQTAYVALIALGQPLTFWDSWVTWSMKARALFLEQSFSPALLTDASRAVTHLDYPLLLPLAQAAVYQFLGAPDDRFVGWIALPFFIALVALVYAAARTFGATKTRALLAAAVVGALPTVALLAAQNYADIPLAAYGILTVTYLLRWIARGERGTLVVAILGAACLAWTKREGVVLAFSISLAAVILLPRVSRARRGALACALASGLVAIIWSILLAALGTTNTDFMPLTFSTFIQNLERVPTILFYFASTLVSAQWAFVWICSLVLLLFRLVRPADRSSDLFLVSAVLYVATLGLSYIFSDYAPYTAHLASSGYRLIAHVTPFIVIWLALQRAPISALSNPTGAGLDPKDFRHAHGKVGAPL